MREFSILTACHNNRQFLPEYFDSVCSQSYPKLEIIFVDDASNDSSLSYATSMAAKDSRIKVISQKTMEYCSSTYANALNHATGDICGVVDADDILMPDAVQKIVNLYKKHPEISFIYTQHYWCNAKMKDCHKGLSAIPKEKSIVESVLAGQHCFSHWRTFRRLCSEKAVLFPRGLKYSVDKNLGFVLEEVGRGAFCPEAMYRYRYHKNNMSLTAARRQKKTTRQLAKQFYNKRLENNTMVYQIRKIK